MQYKTSLLIYRTQTINADDIWKAKVRLVKNLTPLFRKLNADDFRRIEEYNNQYKILVTKVTNQIAPIQLSIQRETDPGQKDLLRAQISELKIGYLEDRSSLSGQLKNDKLFELEANTRLLSLLYSTWSEAVFKKLKHTPHGLPLTDRERTFGNKIEDQWSNFIDLILTQIPLNGNQADLDKMKLELKDIANSYIIEPSKIRNKIAHGQWSEALNGENTDLIIESSLTISDLDIVHVDFSFDIHHYFSEILESILESNDPEEMILDRHDSYLFLKDRLDTFIDKRKAWSTKSRSAFLQQRRRN